LQTTVVVVTSDFLYTKALSHLKKEEDWHN
jgi:hypothetical protein